MNMHTPGPWNVQEAESCFRVVDYRALEYMSSRLCDVHHWSGESSNKRGPNREEARANARLIAAAPDLLEALELMVNTHDDGGWPSSTLVIARAAIAKAKDDV